MAKETQRVEAVSTDREFEDFMLSTYPGIIKEENYEKQQNGRKRVYKFKELDYTPEIREFFKGCKGKYDFELRDAKGRVLMLSRACSDDIRLF